MSKYLEDIEALKNSLSITLVAKALGLEVEKGKCRCFYPTRHIHGDRTPSVSVSESKGLYNCFVCPDVSGDVIRLVEQVKSCSFTEAVHWLKTEFREDFPLKSLDENIQSHKGKVQSEPKQKNDLPEKYKLQLILAFLKKLEPVENTPAAYWLIRRKIFRNTWNRMRLRYVHDYEGISRELLQEFGLELLQKAGMFNEKGNLRYYKHRLIFPYLDKDFRPFYFQARAIEKETKPKEQNLTGTVPFPYNLSVLDEKPGWVYLCEGVIDTLTLIEKKMPAVGVPGVQAFKASFVPLFKNKKVVLCFDNDEAGRMGSKIVQELLSASSIQWTTGENLKLPEAFRFKEGEDINSKFGGKV